MAKHLTIEQFEGLEDVQKNVETGSKEHILNLQLVMATSSVNHEYARMEYEETNDIERKDELMHYMTECREKYDEAREYLLCLNPLTLETFENDLAHQKSTTMVHYHA